MTPRPFPARSLDTWLTTEPDPHAGHRQCEECGACWECDPCGCSLYGDMSEPLGDRGPEEDAAMTLYDAVEAYKRRLIEGALTQAGGVRSEAARQLGIPRSYLQHLMRQLGVQAPPSPYKTWGKAR